MPRFTINTFLLAKIPGSAAMIPNANSPHGITRAKGRRYLHKRNNSRRCYASDAFHHINPMHPIPIATPAIKIDANGNPSARLKTVRITAWLIQKRTRNKRHRTIARTRMIVKGRSMRSFSACFFKICARHQITPGLGSSGWWSAAIFLMRESNSKSLFMRTSEAGLLQHVFGFFPRAKDHHAHASFFHAQYSADFLVAHLLNVRQPQYGAFLRAQPAENRCHIERQIKLLLDMLGEVAHLPQFLFALQFPPAVAQEIRRSLVEIAFAGQIVHCRRMQHADVCLLQNLIGSGGIAGQPAEITMQCTRRARIESLELGVAGLLGFLCACFRHGCVPCCICRKQRFNPCSSIESQPISFGGKADKKSLLKSETLLPHTWTAFPLCPEAKYYAAVLRRPALRRQRAEQSQSLLHS